MSQPKTVERGNLTQNTYNVMNGFIACTLSIPSRLFLATLAVVSQLELEYTRSG